MREKYFKDKYYIAVFDSRNHAVHLYQHLKRANHNEFQLISTPCKIKSGCSYSIKFDLLEDYDTLAAEAVKINIKPSSVYVAERENKHRVLRKMEIT